MNKVDIFFFNADFNFKWTNNRSIGVVWFLRKKFMPMIWPCMLHSISCITIIYMFIPNKVYTVAAVYLLYPFYDIFDIFLPLYKSILVYVNIFWCHRQSWKVISPNIVLCRVVCATNNIFISIQVTLTIPIHINEHLNLQMLHQFPDDDGTSFESHSSLDPIKQNGSEWPNPLSRELIKADAGIITAHLPQSTSPTPSEPAEERQELKVEQDAESQQPADEEKRSAAWGPSGSGRIENCI